MLTFIFYIIIILLIIYMIKNHIKIKFKTFFKKGFKKTSKPYGVYCYCGKQGKGKTYSVIEFLLENSDKEIYCNIGSITGIKYHYINGIDELLSLRNKTNCIIVFDEIFTILQKGSKMNDDILDFLSQMRKREMIFITTAQEWLEINMTLRRYCRYQIECNMFSILGYPILKKKMCDAEQMKWSQEDNEYIAPVISTTISHGLKKVIDSYDTYEQIGKYSNFSSSFADILGEEEEKTAIATTTTNSNCCVSVSKGDFPLFDNENSDTPSQKLVCQECQSVSDDDSDKSILIDDEFWTDLSKKDIEINIKND